MQVGYFLILSLCIHIILMLTYFAVPKDFLQTPTNTTSVEIIEQPFPKTSEKNKQWVRDVTPPKNQKDEDLNKAARFLSARTQRVLVETKAQNSGLTENRQAAKFTLPKEDQEQKEQPKKDNDPFAQYQPIKIGRSWDHGESTVGEALPEDLSIGSFTALNTDAYQYYTFFARIEELIRFRWETRVRDTLDAFERQKGMLDSLGQRNWITHATFLLTPDGRLQKAIIMKPSGIEKFDFAAIDSFQDAKIFPNPPKEMIESDGLVHLKYSFHVYFNPSNLVSR